MSLGLSRCLWFALLLRAQRGSMVAEFARAVTRVPFHQRVVETNLGSEITVSGGQGPYPEATVREQAPASIGLTHLATVFLNLLMW